MIITAAENHATFFMKYIKNFYLIKLKNSPDLLYFFKYKSLISFLTNFIFILGIIGLLSVINFFRFFIFQKNHLLFLNRLHNINLILLKFYYNYL